MRVSTSLTLRAGLVGCALALALVSALPTHASSIPAADAPGESGAGSEESAEKPPAAEPEASKAGVTSLTQTLQGDSGISVQTLCTNCNNADLSMSGLGNEHVAVTCDGMPVPGGLAQIYLLSVMPPTMIDKVAVKKGAGETELDAGAVGGGIEIELRRPKPGFQLNTSADTGEYGWTGSKLDLSGRAGRFGGSFAGSWGTSDEVASTRTGLGQTFDYKQLPSFDRYTVEGKAEVRLGRNQRLRFGAFDYDESQKDGPAAPDYRTDPNNGDFELKLRGYNLENVELERRQYDALYESSFGDGSRLFVSAMWADRSQDIEETEVSGGDFVPSYFIDEIDRYGGASWSRTIGQKTTVSVGASGTRSRFEIVDVNFNLFNHFDELLTFALEETITEKGAWLEGGTALGRNVELSVGLRYVDYSYEDNEEREQWLAYPLPEGERWLPRATLTWKPVDAIQLRLSGGAGFRVPQPIHEEVCCGRRYRNNRGVLTEKSESYGVELTYQPQPRYRVGGSVFMTDFEDYILKMTTLSYQFRPTYQNANVPKARSTSLSLDTRLELTSRVSAKASATWTDVQNRTEDNAVPTLIDFFSTPVEKEFRFEKLPYVATRRGSVGFDFKLPNRFGFGVTAQYTGPMRIQHYDNDFDSLDFDLGGSEVQPDLIQSADFWMVNLNLSKSFNRGVAVFAGVDNLNDYVQTDLGDPTTDYNWGPLRGRYVYGGLSYRFASSLR